MADCPKCGCAPARAQHSTEVMRLAANGDGRMVSIGPCQNRVEVLAFPAPAVVAGTVDVFRVEADPTGGQALTSLVGSIVYNINGGRLVFQLPPGGRVFVKLSAYGGVGTISAVVTSWEQS